MTAAGFPLSIFLPFSLVLTVDVVVLLQSNHVISLFFFYLLSIGEVTRSGGVMLRFGLNFVSSNGGSTGGGFEIYFTLLLSISADGRSGGNVAGLDGLKIIFVRYGCVLCCFVALFYFICVCVLRLISKCECAKSTIPRGCMYLMN